jgi:hypothetical protein
MVPEDMDVADTHDLDMLLGSECSSVRFPLGRGGDNLGRHKFRPGAMAYEFRSAY